MSVKSYGAFFILLLTACMTSQKDTGYYKVRPSISNDSVNKVRSYIFSIDNDNFRPLQYTGPDGTVNYRLLTPATVNKGERYPLVLVLHSSGKPIGTDNISQLGILVKLWAQPGIRKNYPAYVVAPQFARRSSNYVLDPVRHVLASAPDPCLSTALQLVDSLTRTLPIDTARVYVMGFSMGGSSAINSLELRPHLFAACISISGIPGFRQIETISQVPVWLVHGNADTENPFSSDSLLYKELRSVHGRHVRFWEVDKLDHAVYPGLYSGDLIPQWLFKQKK
ncbi:MAG: hypothetical protein J0H74_35220 [Chitinophagaceae bacterium]|nr:hypothetical protein [Chitinophagaceae bacterium]